jgi:hypothetical protein
MGSIWGDIYGQDDDSYGWWEVYTMTPDLEIPDHKLICVMNQEYTGCAGFPPQRHLLDDNLWDILLGVIKNSEVDHLVQLLNRNK